MAEGTPIANPMAKRSNTSRITSQITAAQSSISRARTHSGADIKGNGVVAPVGNEHLPADAFPRPFVKRIRDHADDLDIELRLRAAAAAQVPSDRTLVSEVVPGETLV